MYNCIEIYTHPFIQDDVVYDLFSCENTKENYVLEDSVTCIENLSEYEKTFYNEM